MGEYVALSKVENALKGSRFVTRHMPSARLSSHSRRLANLLMPPSHPRVAACPTSCRFVALPMVYARSTMSYAIALICPMEAELRKLGLAPDGCTMAQLCANADVISAVAKDLAQVGKAAKLAPFEVPKKVVLIEELWSVENNMLTAVAKLKRKDIEARHKAQIEAVYK